MITPAALFVKLLGKTSSINTMNRLGENTVFIGSHMGHHKILRLQNEFEDVTEIKTIDNLGPIVDIYVSEFEKHSEVVMCSGKDQDSSLKIVRKGITPKIEAKVQIQHATDVFSLKASIDEEFYKYLIVSFISETHVLQLIEGTF